MTLETSFGHAADNDKSWAQPGSRHRWWSGGQFSFFSSSKIRRTTNKWIKARFYQSRQNSHSSCCALQWLIREPGTGGRSSFDRLISIVSSRFKRASTFLHVSFPIWRDERNENGPISSTFLHVSFQNNKTRMAKICSTAGACFQTQILQKKL